MLIEYVRITCHECERQFDIDADTFDDTLVIECPHCNKDLLRSKVQWRYVERTVSPVESFWDVV